MPIDNDGNEHIFALRTAMGAEGHHTRNPDDALIYELLYDDGYSFVGVFTWANTPGARTIDNEWTSHVVGPGNDRFDELLKAIENGDARDIRDND